MHSDKYLNLQLRISHAFPSLSWVCLLSMLRHIEEKEPASQYLTLSRFGFSPNSSKSLLPRSVQPKKYKQILNTIQKSKLNLEQSILEAYSKAEGIEIDTLNLLYANLVLNRSRLGWVKFLNNYLGLRGGWRITLKKQSSENILEDLYSDQPFDESSQDTLVTVIMPAFNNADTVSYAANSILNQTHKNVELIIVDDCSYDATEMVCRKIAESDSRVKYIRNPKNSGAYFSRNCALKISKGKYITVLDADDWSFPQRISYQLSRLVRNKNAKAHLGYYLRLKGNGLFTAFRICGKFSYDGALHKCLASLMVDAAFMKKNLGYWDSVRFGADSELYSRILKICGESSIIEDPIPLMLALDREGSLTTTEDSKLGSKERMEYAENFAEWHKKIPHDLFIEFPLNKRPFQAPEIMVVK